MDINDIDPHEFFSLDDMKHVSESTIDILMSNARAVHCGAQNIRATDAIRVVRVVTIRFRATPATRQLVLG